MRFCGIPAARRRAGARLARHGGVDAEQRVHRVDRIVAAECLHARRRRRTAGTAARARRARGRSAARSSRSVLASGVAKIACVEAMTPSCAEPRQVREGRHLDVLDAVAAIARAVHPARRARTRRAPCGSRRRRSRGSGPAARRDRRPRPSRSRSCLRQEGAAIAAADVGLEHHRGLRVDGAVEHPLANPQVSSVPRARLAVGRVAPRAALARPLLERHRRPVTHRQPALPAMARADRARARCR